MNKITNIVKNNPKLFKNARKISNNITGILYKYARILIKVDEKMVLFDAFLGRSYACNPKFIFEEMRSDPKFKDWTFIWSMREETEIEGATVVRYKSFKYHYYLAKSKFWVFNSKMPKYICKKANQVYLQTWHGTPLKKLARDIEIGENSTFYRTKMSKEEMVKTYDEDVNKYNYLISPNSYSTKNFISAFNVDEKIIIETGYPRNDKLLKYTKDTISDIKSKLKIDRSKKIILYAPTWRDNIYNVEGYSFKPKVDFRKWKNKIGDEYIVIYKPHYLISNDIYDNSLNDFVYFSKATDDIHDLYLISDILITDYSSVFFDYSVLQRPILFYMFDLKEYENEVRGFYFDITQLPGPIIENEDTLLQNIKNIDDISKKNKGKYEEFHKKMCYLEDGFSSDRVIKKVFESKI